MGEIKDALSDIKYIELDDLKDKYTLAIKMLFALIESIEECATKGQQTKIFNMYNSLISNE
jgi:hypothetical protein